MPSGHEKYSEVFGFPFELPLLFFLDALFVIDFEKHSSFHTSKKSFFAF